MKGERPHSAADATAAEALAPRREIITAPKLIAAAKLSREAGRVRFLLISIEHRRDEQAAEQVRAEPKARVTRSRGLAAR